MKYIDDEIKDTVESCAKKLSILLAIKNTDWKGVDKGAVVIYCNKLDDFSKNKYIYKALFKKITKESIFLYDQQNCKEIYYKDFVLLEKDYKKLILGINYDNSIQK